MIKSRFTIFYVNKVEFQEFNKRKTKHTFKPDYLFSWLLKGNKGMDSHLPSTIIASSVSYVLAFTNSILNAPSKCSSKISLFVMFIQVLVAYCRAIWCSFSMERRAHDIVSLCFYTWNRLLFSFCCTILLDLQAMKPLNQNKKKEGKKI